MFIWPQFFPYLCHVPFLFHLTSNKNEYQEISLVVKAADTKGWQTCYLYVLCVWKSWQPQRPGALRACPGLFRGYLYFYIYYLLYLQLSLERNSNL